MGAPTETLVSDHPLLAAPSEGRERGQARGVRGGTELCAGKLRAGAVSQEGGHRTVGSERSNAPKEPRSDCSTAIRRVPSMPATPAPGW